MTVYEIYDQTIKPLSTDDRSRLIELILDDLTPQPPNTIRDHAHLEQLLLESLEGETHEVTDETWKRRFERIQARGNGVPAEAVSSRALRGML